MATTRITAQLPPNIDPTKAPLAYGDRALPKLNRELNSATLITRQRALMALCDVMHNAEHICSALRVGIVASLRRLLSDTNPVVRMKTTEVLFIMAGHAVGRTAFLENYIIIPLAKLFDDEVYDVRLNAHKAIQMSTQSPPGPEGVINARLIESLVSKLKIEEDDIREVILDTLHSCMFIDTDQALEASAMSAFTMLLSHDRPSIRCKAARDIMDLSFPLDGKRKACEENTIPSLVILLRDDHAEVRAKAAGALMVITITTEGKYKSIESKSIPPLISLLSDVHSEARLNAIKAITTLAEAPSGRQELQQVIEKLQFIQETDTSDAVIKAAKAAIKVITWKP
ncbi:Radial spoke head 14-like protein [Trichoplax sp. H2]|nr:Radial spoke head 14-like protein [Trichoplax sp. H2]|eukprot:RDD44693.1 Radial spoke head 14-like protein [Trichoplax sp. H2]